MKKKEFLSAGEAARALGVSVKTIQRWDKAGLLPVIRTATNQRRIPVDTIHHLLKAQGKSLRCAIYARVSSAKQEQEGNLTRKAGTLATSGKGTRLPGGALIQERASSLNEKRKGMQGLFHLIDQQEIDVALIEYPDRLVHFGFGYLEETFRWKQVRLEVGDHPRRRPQPKNWFRICSALSPSFRVGCMEAERKKFGPVGRMRGSDCLKAEEADGTDH
jgi:putative resolvase